MISSEPFSNDAWVRGWLSFGMTGGGIAFWAHVGGFAFGFVVMKLLGGARQRSGAWTER